MKNLVTTAVLVAAMASVVLADPIVITKYDGVSRDDIPEYKKGSWYTAHEDNEVEFEILADGTYYRLMEATQQWDMEGFIMNGNDLTMVGGYNFKNGYDGTVGGDIFVDVDGNGYDYAIVMNFSNNTYNVYEVDGAGELEKVKYYNSPESDPFKYIGDKDVVTTGSFAYQTVSGDYLVGDAANTVYTGGNHNVISGIDLSFLKTSDFTVHYTMQCGNDNLMGNSSTVSLPEPGTLSLLSMGTLFMVGYWTLRRKKNNK